MMQNDQPVINKIRLPDEHIIAITACSSYEPSKLKMRALKNLIKSFENRLEECDKILNEFSENNGVVYEDIDGYYSFSHKGSEFEICVSNASIDYESFIEILEVAKAYKKSIALKKAISKAKSAIDIVTEDMSLNGTSEFAQSVRKDPRFMATLMDGCEFEDETEDEEEDEEE